MPAADPTPPRADDHQEREARVHDLKTWPEYFERVLDGTKTFEIRKNDRGFEVGDTLRLREWQPPFGDRLPVPGTGGYTGREVSVVVSYLTDFAQKPGHVVMGFRRVAPEPVRSSLFDDATKAQIRASVGLPPKPEQQQGGEASLYGPLTPLEHAKILGAQCEKLRNEIDALKAKLKGKDDYIDQLLRGIVDACGEAWSDCWEMSWQDMMAMVREKIAAPAPAPAAPVGVTITRYELDGTEPHNPITIERTHHERAHRWAVRRGGCCLDRDGAWVFEPLPSLRDDAYYAQHRWTSMEAALAAAIAAAGKGT